MSIFNKTVIHCALIFATTSLSLSSAHAVQTKPAQTKAWQDKINAAAAKELKQTGTPSLQIAIGYKGEVIFSGAYGMADLENQVAATVQTKYRIASVSKWLTATAAMTLAEQGQLDLDKPIQTYCPQFPEKGGIKSHPITSRQLLTHTSGIRHYANYHAQLEAATTDKARAEIERRRDRDYLGRYSRYTDVVTPLDNFKDDALLFTPGTDWKYTSYGYRVLACVMEGAAGKPYRTIMQDVIFSPTGMTSTVDDDAWAIIPHRAAGYRLNQDKDVRRADMRDVSENLPAGGHLSSATDMVRFAQAFDRGVFVPAKTVQMMRGPLNKDVPQQNAKRTWRDAIPSGAKYGYGVMSFPDSKGTWFGHDGRQAGSASMVISIPQQQLSIAILTNAKGWRGYISLTEQLVDIMSDAGFNL